MNFSSAHRGAGLTKLDLHIHTPLSYCYEDNMYPELRRQTRPEDLVQAAREAGLDAIAITDHNGAEWIEEIRTAARGSDLYVFPGVELSARGGHVLGIFDGPTSSEVIRRLVHTLGFTESHYGDGFAQSSVWIDEVFQHIAELGGLAIAAHIDREPRGFIASELSQTEKVRVFHSPHLAALEITDPREKSRWNAGTVPRFPMKRACIQSSDAHAPQEIGRRPFYARLPSLDLAGLRAALQAFASCVWFPQELERAWTQEM